MTSSVSIKDLSKAITAFIPTAALSLPPDLIQLIEVYLEKHPENDQAVSERVNEELMSLHQKHVASYPDRYVPFLVILRLLHPAIRPYMLQWYDLLVGPVLNHLGHEKGLAEVAITNIKIIIADSEDPSEGAEKEGQLHPLGLRLMETWAQIGKAPLPDSDTSPSAREDMLKETLYVFGKQKPKAFLRLIDKYLVQKDYRGRSINLLCEFVQRQPPHLYAVMDTPLFENLLRCLQLDTCTTIVSLALTALIMLLPNMPSSLVPHLPIMFNIYARLLFWDREVSMTLESAPADPEKRSPTAALPTGWNQCVFHPNSDGSTVPHLLGYFTILYGLYPINFMDYIRKPQRYRHASVPSADNIEIQPYEVRHRSEKFRQCHLLHPNFYSMTIESEKSDFGRWLKVESPDVVAECVALCVTTESGQLIRSDSLVLPRSGSQMTLDGDHALLGDNIRLSITSVDDQQRPAEGVSPPSSRAQSTGPLRTSSLSSHVSTRDSIDAHAKESGIDSPMLPSSASHPELQDMINSNKALKSSIHQSMTNDSVPSLSLSSTQQDQASDGQSASKAPPLLQPSAGSVSSPGISSQVAGLSRQVLLLKNDLNFERYMKQQHMAHIGLLQRRRIREAASEAETQDLINANRNLKHRLEESKRTELQTKKESERSRTMAKNWEADLSSKLRNLRAEQKKWGAKEQTLQRDLDLARDECQKLRQLLCDAEVRELNSKQEMEVMQLGADGVAKLDRVIEELRRREKEIESMSRDLVNAQQEAEQGQRRALELDLMLGAKERDLEQTKDYYEAQVGELQARVTEAVNNPRRVRDANANSDVSAFENALAGSRAKQLDLQKQYTLLMQRYNRLQSTLLEKTATISPTRTRQDHGTFYNADAEVSAIVGSPLGSGRSRPPLRGASDPESFDLQSTPPLELSSSMRSTSTAIHRPPSPSTGTPGDGHGTGTSSPQTERYHGRGGVQNAKKKDKVLKKEEPEKKERKASGIRSIRGFV